MIHFPQSAEVVLPEIQHEGADSPALEIFQRQVHSVPGAGAKGVQSDVSDAVRMHAVAH